MRRRRRYASARGSAPEKEHMVSIPQWEYPVYASERVKDRKSVFLAHASTLPSASALPPFIEQLSALPALKRATHYYLGNRMEVKKEAENAFRACWRFCNAKTSSL
ncbi:unnamed protein product [Cyclocybe aegerita]|uniref:Uncharacterized protein n=1 Tax=Cyclocybe aegerita TaxID=1973307 RepID=A0A8S0WGL8_CYCAE|nr:unnamed protein product [Cyclocybe aegerita]